MTVRSLLCRAGLFALVAAGLGFAVSALASAAPRAALSNPGRGAADPPAVVDQSELRDRISDAISALPEREKLVVALYYYENLTLREIGEVLGVTESRVSQLHTKAVLRLRSKLAGELD